MVDEPEERDRQDQDHDDCGPWLGQVLLAGVVRDDRRHHSSKPDGGYDRDVDEEGGRAPEEGSWLLLKPVCHLAGHDVATATMLQVGVRLDTFFRGCYYPARYFGVVKGTFVS